MGAMNQLDQELANLSNYFDSVWNSILSASNASSVLTAPGYGVGQIDLSGAAQATVSENRPRAVENNAKHSLKVASLFISSMAQKMFQNHWDL